MSAEKDRPAAPIERDPTFSRRFVDSCLAYFLGRDMELVLLQNGPEVSEGIENLGDKTRSVFSAESKRTDVGRVRLPTGAAITLAFEILGEAVNSKTVKREQITRKLEELLKLYRSELDDGA